MHNLTDNTVTVRLDQKPARKWHPVLVGAPVAGFVGTLRP